MLQESYLQKRFSLSLVGAETDWLPDKLDRLLRLVRLLDTRKADLLPAGLAVYLPFCLYQSFKFYEVQILGLQSLSAIPY